MSDKAGDDAGAASPDVFERLWRAAKEQEVRRTARREQLWRQDVATYNFFQPKIYTKGYRACQTKTEGEEGTQYLGDGQGRRVSADAPRGEHASPTAVRYEYMFCSSPSTLGQAIRESGVTVDERRVVQVFNMLVNNDSITQGQEDDVVKIDRGLDALLVVISQSCDNGRDKWFRSTLHLQLVSRTVCVACRSLYAYQLSVHQSTPSNLRTFVNRNGRNRDRDCIPAPRLSAVVWWKKELSLLGGSYVLDKVESFIFGDSFNGSVSRVRFRTGIKAIKFGDQFNQPIYEIGWPASLQQLSFGRRFNQPIHHVKWPRSLQHLSFGSSFNRIINGNLLPRSLLELNFGYDFNRSIHLVMWPKSLQRLTFGSNLNTPLDGVIWPASLQEITFGYRFDFPIDVVAWPASLRRMTFGSEFDSPIDLVVWPASLEQLTFGYKFNQPIDGVAWPSSLRRLTFGEKFNQPIDAVSWPASLQHITLGRKHQLPLDAVTWPPSLETLTVARKRDNELPALPGVRIERIWKFFW